MSMLAERRARKGYNIVPRGKPLFKDENHFGTRMLKKMGWTEGKGLGAYENGSVDFIRVKYKHDSVGLGYEDRDSQWMEHQENFGHLLENLANIVSTDNNNLSQKMNNDEVDSNVSNTVGFGFNNSETKKSLKDKLSGESLEGKSKISKVRVHYKKFTKQKDISQYSEKDLANIFGKKFDNQIENTKEENMVKDNKLNTNISKSFKSKYKNLTNQSLTIVTDEEIKEPKKKKKKHLEDNYNESIDTLEREASNSLEKPSKIMDQTKCEQEEYREPETYNVSLNHLNILRHVDCDQFKGSNIKDICGYGIANKIKIKPSKSASETLEVSITAEENNKYKMCDKQNKKETESEKTNTEKKKKRKHKKKSVLKMI